MTPKACRPDVRSLEREEAMSTNQIKLSDLFYVFGILAIAVAYYWMAQVGFMFAWRHTNVSAIWPPSALGFIAIYVLGPRLWPGIWLGAFLANISYFFSDISFNLLQTVLFSASIATGNTLEALVSCLLLKKLIENKNPLHKVQSISRFMLTGMLGCMIAASIGSVTVCLSNIAFWHSYLIIWSTWWLGDFSGLLTLTPLFWALGQRPFSKSKPKQIIEFAVSLSIFVLFNGMLFNGNSVISQTHIPITYFPLALMVWLTYRFGYWGAITSILFTLYQAIEGTNRGFGPFITNDLNMSLFLLQTFIGTVCGTCLLLAAALYERRHAQQKVIFNEQRFRALVENSSDMVVLLNPVGVISYSSPSTEKVLGYKKNEHEGRSIFEFIHPEDRSRIMSEFSRLLGHPDEIIKATARVRHKNGSWHWIEGSGQNLLAVESVGAIVVNYRDITENKMARERFEKVFEFSPLAKIMAGKGGKVQLVNKSAEILFGYSQEELLSMNIEDLVPQQFRGTHSALREGFYNDPKPRPMGGDVRVLYGLRKDGRQIPVDIALTPIETGQGVSILATIVDITERKKAEDILKNELKQATRLADIGTLAAIVAHELRTPLGVIQMAAHNFRNKNSQFMQDKHLDNIQKKVWEGNRIINNLLSYSSIKAPTYEPCKILALLEECVVNAENQFKEQAVTIERDYLIEKDFVVEIDSNQIREVLINVLSNAYQAMQTKDGRLKLTVQKQGEDFKIIIKDNGAGIDPEDLEKIFRPFFTTKAKGTGLGLTICNELINLHYGQFDIQSIKGQGTEVYVVLPVQRKTQGG